MKAKKAGPWSKEDKEFIKQNSSSMSYEEIANHLRRNVDKVEKFIKDNNFPTKKFGTLSHEDTDIIYRLKGLDWWGSTEKQLDEQELKFFELFWIRLYKQFDYDVLPSEEIQIRKFITLEIMKDRALEKIKRTKDSIVKIEDSYREELALDKDQRDIEVLKQFKDELSSMKSSLPSLNNEYKEFCKEQTTVEKGLNASRNDRVQNVQDASKNWSAMLRSLEDPKIRKEVGKFMEIHRVARDKEMIRLTRLHQYVDGEFDRPILSGKLEDLYEEDTK